MAEVVDNAEVLRVTGLTPTPEAVPPPEGSTPAADASSEDVPKLPDEPAGGSGEETTSTQGDEPPRRKPAQGVQKFIDRKNEEISSLRDNLSRTQGTLQALQQVYLTERMQAEGRQVPAAPTQGYQGDPNDPKPDPNKYPTWEAGQEAVSAWVSRNETKRALDQRMAEYLTFAQRAEMANRQQQYVGAVAGRLAAASLDGGKRFEDWSDKSEAAWHRPTTAAMVDAIARSADPAGVMHFLASNEQAHARVYQADPAETYQIITRIETALAAQRVSKAPPPARPVAGRGSGVSGPVYSDNMTPEQHRAWAAKNGQTRGLR